MFTVGVALSSSALASTAFVRRKPPAQRWRDLPSPSTGSDSGSIAGTAFASKGRARIDVHTRRRLSPLKPSDTSPSTQSDSSVHSSDGNGDTALRPGATLHVTDSGSVDSRTNEKTDSETTRTEKASPKVLYDGNFLPIPYVPEGDTSVRAKEISFRTVAPSFLCFAVQSKCSLPLNCTSSKFHETIGLDTAYQMPRPASTTGDTPAPAVLCASNQSAPIASISYFNALQPADPSQITRIGVRTFLNPGYEDEIRFRCEDCRKYHVLAIRVIPVNCIPRIPAAEQPESSIYSDECLQVDPCQYDHWDGEHSTFDSFSDRTLSLNNTRIVFRLKSSRRVDPNNRQKWFQQHNALCMYTGYNATSGDFVGFLDIHLDGADVQAFVCFVCFFGVALPLLCIMTLLLHANKLARCKLRVQTARLRRQRVQLEEELLTRDTENPAE